MKYPFIFLSGMLLGAIVNIAGINYSSGKTKCESDNQKCVLVAVKQGRDQYETI